MRPARLSFFTLALALVHGWCPGRASAQAEVAPVSSGTAVMPPLEPSSAASAATSTPAPVMQPAVTPQPVTQTTATQLPATQTTATQLPATQTTATQLPANPWDVEFAQAKDDFIAGRFKTAAQKFESLAARAATPLQRARVEELLQAANEWTRRDVALVEQRELVGTDVMSRRTDRRTADEIGVLYLSAIGYGLGTGIWIDFLTEPDSVAGAVMPPLLLAGAAVGGVALLDSGKGLRYGTAQSISTGMTIGFWQGFAWGTYYQATSTYDAQMSEQTYVSLLWATTTAGAVAGGVIGSVNSTTPGRAAFVGSATLWPAVVFGLGAGALGSDDDRADDRAMLASALGASVGTIGGVLAAGSVSPTTARVRFLDLGAIGGGLAIGGLALALRGEESDDGREIMLATDLGIVAGLGLAWWLTDGMPRDLGAHKQSSQFKPTITPTVLPQRGGMGLGAVGLF